MPELLISSSQKIKASAGFDAIAQSLESLVSRKSNSKSVLFASKSLQISIKSFDNYLGNPTLRNAGKMSIASHLAGKAINISKTTAPHAASYPFTSFFNISHGHAVSCLTAGLLRLSLAAPVLWHFAVAAASSS